MNAPQITYEELTLPFDAATNIRIFNKRPAGVETFTADKVAIMVHGASYSSVSFDMAYGGQSWMDYMAGRGFDVYTFDFPGFGKSTWPALMDAPPEGQPPYMRKEEAIQFLTAVVNFVMKRRSVPQVNLVGWCSGATWSGMYAAFNKPNVRRLVLYAQRRLDLIHTTYSDEVYGSHRMLTKDGIMKQWMQGISKDKFDSVMTKARVDEWLAAMFSKDPRSDGNSMRVPSGPMADMRDGMLNLEKTAVAYHAGRVIAPVLLIGGEWDQMSQPMFMHDFFTRFTSAAWKRMVTIGEGTHFLFLERNRTLLFQAVQQFLEEDDPPARDAIT